MSDSIILFYVTLPHTESGTQIAKKLLEDKLIACANILPSHTSVYEWDGKIVEENEHVMILKTRAELAQKVEEVVSTMYPYDTPCILQINTEGVNSPFSEWINQQTSVN